MITGFAVAVAACSLAIAVWSFILVVKNRTPSGYLLIGLAAVEGLLVVQLLIAIAAMIIVGAPVHLATFIAYLVASVLTLPLGTMWALAERSRSSTAILGIAGITVPVLVLRLHEVWGATGA